MAWLGQVMRCLVGQSGEQGGYHTIDPPAIPREDNMDKRITENVLNIENYIMKTWGFKTKKEVKLSGLFPEPENSGLKHIWRYGSADLVVYKNGKPVALVEVGGGQHFKEKQSLNDRRKWKLCDTNNTNCLEILNGTFERMSNTQRRKLIGSFLFKRKEV